MRYGYFDNERREYVIEKVDLPTEYSNASEPPFYRLRATSDFNTLEPSQTQDIVMEP